MTELRFGVVSESVRAGRAWLDFARQVEDSGIDVLLLRDHFSAGPFGQQLAPFSGLAAAAAATTRLRLGTLVLSNDFRHPAIVAHLARRERFGLSYLVAGEDSRAALAEVICGL
jgi:alkanesulfonate monooxygenase SsuD/methylene tetrahydromethanopterin reductase-like flavin-dependent oxidoreductase (luciferase family)